MIPLYLKQCHAQASNGQAPHFRFIYECRHYVGSEIINMLTLTNIINPKNSAYISNYKIMIMISILKWQANPFLSYIIFQLIATDNICRQGSVFGCKIESHSHVL